MSNNDNALKCMYYLNVLLERNVKFLRLHYYIFEEA